VPRTTRFELRLTPEEKHAILERARLHGYSVSDFLREGAIYGCVQPVPDINHEQWHKLSGACSNLNQVVRLCHVGAVPKELGPIAESALALVIAIRHDLITPKGGVP
jgi:hypothetical protein